MPDLDADLQRLLDDLYAMKLFDWEGLDAPAVRSKFAAIKTVAELPEIAQVRDIEVPGQGGPVSCRLCHPDPTVQLPLMVWFHGGGWVLGNLDQEEATARRLAIQGHMAVLSVEYRLAPEHPFPAAFDDACNAWQWARAHADELGCHAEGVAVGGGSSGGNLAAATALWAVTNGESAPAHQLLVYPVVDADLDRPSMLQYADGLVLHRAHMQWFWDQYVPDVSQRGDWRAAPLHAPSHAGLPPATIVLAQHDPLIDEGRAYAEALVGAGVDVELIVGAGMTHGFQGMAAAVPAAASILEATARSVGQQLALATAH